MACMPRYILDKYARFFRPGFLDWLDRNQHIYGAFEEQALRLIEVGRTHYSARTIIEVMVHDSIIRETAGGEFKIGNDKAPDLARVFVICFPWHIGFWEYRRPDWRDFVAAVEKSLEAV